MSQVRRNDAYAITQNEAEVDRLVTFARARDPHVRDGLARIGVDQGWKAIDVGCGPLGALLTLAESVGRGGVVVGMDMHEPSLERARSILHGHGMDWIDLVHANINDAPASVVCPPGPLDVAFCRNFLTHQKDPAESLRRIAGIVRPGGYIVAQSDMDNPWPWSDPQVPALAQYSDWVLPLFRRLGSSTVARRYHGLCHAAGLIEVSQRGFFAVATDGSIVRATRESLASWRAAIVEGGLATEAQVDVAYRELEEAENREFEATFSTLSVELIAQVP